MNPNQCGAECACACSNGDGGKCATTTFCVRAKGHAGKHSWSRGHECWHFDKGDVWCRMATPYTKAAR